MDVLRALIQNLQLIAEQCATIGNWFTTEIAVIGNVSITPLTIMLPTVLIAILGFVIVRFLLI